MRRKIIAGNWKMNKTANEAAALAQELAVHVKMNPHPKVETLIAPPFPFLQTCVRSVSEIPGFHVAAQNCHQEKSGAFTGEVSAEMIASLGVSHVIIGHSERRTFYGETNEILKAKLNAAIEQNLIPVFCVGETLEERNNHRQVLVIEEQLQHTVCQLDYAHLRQIVIAYEPVWAIGTGLTATPELAQEMHVVIRNIISKSFGHGSAETVPILYGGSCNPKNAASLFACDDVDGALIGGASLNANDFLTIRNAMLLKMA